MAFSSKRDGRRCSRVAHYIMQTQRRCVVPLLLRELVYARKTAPLYVLANLTDSCHFHPYLWYCFRHPSWFKGRREVVELNAVMLLYYYSCFPIVSVAERCLPKKRGGL